MNITIHTNPKTFTMAKPHLHFLFFLAVCITLCRGIISQDLNYAPATSPIEFEPETETEIENKLTEPYFKNRRKPDNETVFRASKQLCWRCFGEALEFLYRHNLARAAKWELPLAWDWQLERYAQRWAGIRKSDCQLEHSFPEGQFTLGENIFWGSGSDWTPTDAVRVWTDEEKYYDYATNTCAAGQMCGHYTQIVWRRTSRVGCARVVCDSGDVFMTCNYNPPGNYVGERPY